jgi:hypothetical protein
MERKVCVVCGAPAIGVTGCIFFENGRTKVGAPFCKQHLEEYVEYSNPVFENEAALTLFRKKHPRLYLQRVKNKKILFLARNQIKSIAT